jgi:hypothetical protein
MLLPFPVQYRRRRGRAARVRTTPVPSDPNEITYWGDAHSQGDFQIRLTVQGTVTAIDAPGGLRGVRWQHVVADGLGGPERAAVADADVRQRRDGDVPVAGAEPKRLALCGWAAIGGAVEWGFSVSAQVAELADALL